MGEWRTCKRPDRHVATLICGYPLPCPWHTVVLDMTLEPPTLNEPVSANVSAKARRKLKEIANALCEARDA